MKIDLLSTAIGRLYVKIAKEQGQLLSFIKKCVQILNDNYFLK